jgi:hypothetical protein
VIAFAVNKQTGQSWWLVDLPANGADYGYSTNSADAIEINKRQWRCFKNYQKDVGRDAFCLR